MTHSNQLKVCLFVCFFIQEYIEFFWVHLMNFMLFLLCYHSAVTVLKITKWNPVPEIIATK